MTVLLGKMARPAVVLCLLVLGSYPVNGAEHLKVFTSAVPPIAQEDFRIGRCGGNGQTRAPSASPYAVAVGGTRFIAPPHESSRSDQAPTALSLR